MGKQRFAIKRGFKRPNKSNTSLGVRKDCRMKNEAVRSSSPNPSEDSTEEQADTACEEEVAEEALVYEEPSMYDHLLKTLGSGSESLTHSYRRRQREEEDKSDLDDDISSSSNSSSMPDEEHDGSDDESTKSIAFGNEPQRSSSEGVAIQNEDSGTDDDDLTSDSDKENNFRANSQSTSEATVSISSFSKHLDYKLLKEEVDELSERKLKYKWEVPVADMPNCKWKGTGECFIKDVEMNSDYGLKLRLYNHWLDIYEGSGVTDFHSSKQISFFSLCNSYQDILHHNKKPFYLKGLQEDSSSIMDAYIMHSLNHVFRTRDLVTKNDAKVAKLQDSGKEEMLNSGDFLDHGFTRPKVLILLPLASIAFRVVKRLIQLTPPKHKVNVEYIDRFLDEFGSERTANRDDGDGIENSKSKRPPKPSDFQALFGANKNDHFMLGIKFTRRSIKLYGDFYSSDVIVASPLGLVTKIGEAEFEKEKDVDYLSSIEILIIDHADVIAMQNWSHVNSVVEKLNHIPSKQHGTDIMRIRPWYLDGQAQFYRQTIILGAHLNPDINALFNHLCLNYQGKMKLVCEYKGILPKVLLQVRQIYERFDAESIVDADDARLKYFSEKVFPKIKDSIQGGIMIFISSYFEFVRIRNFLKSQDSSFCLLGEYTKQTDISRARESFYTGKRKIMLYTERAHFYHRYKIGGIQNLIIYSLPERKEFYPEIVNMLKDSHDMTCTILFSQFDQLRLERIVGTAPAKRMLNSDKGIFVFC